MKYLEVFARIAAIYHLPSEAIRPEFFDVFKIISMGAGKYKLNNWLTPDGARTSEKEMHDSMFHHLAQSFSNGDADKESGEDHLLHLATRALMLYTRRQNGIRNSKDGDAV